MDGIQKTGERSLGRGAVAGDKMLVDALVPCAEMLKSNAEAGATLKTALSAGAYAFGVIFAKVARDLVFE